MKTVAAAHAAGKRDGEKGLGPVAPRNGPPGSLAHRLRAAYMQSYRDALIARVGIPERGKNPLHKERIPGTRSVAQRIVNAENAFIQLVMEKGFSRAEATKIMQTYLKLKVAKLDPVGGVIKLQHGAFWELQTLQNALNHQPPARRRKTNPKKKRARRRARPRGKTVTTVTRSKVIRRTNPQPLSVLYIHKGRKRLKYLGRDKFGERGRAKLFTAAAAATTAQLLRDLYPQVLRGWRFTTGTDAAAPAADRRTSRRRLAQGVDPAGVLYREKARQDTEAAHRWLAKQK